MSDNQRRIFCRLVFLFTCALPTATVFYWLCHPQTAGQWEQLVKSQLGVQASIVSIETPGPFVTVLRGLELKDPELDRVFEAMEVRIEFGKANYVTIPHTVRTTNAGLIQLVKTLNEHLIRAHAADRPWRIDFLEKAIIEEAIYSRQTGLDYRKSIVAENLQIDITPLIDGTTAELKFQLEGNDTPIVCTIGRSHFDKHQQSRLRVQLKTNEVPLPCWLVGDLVPEIAALGPDCCFAGNVDLNPRSGKPLGWFAGKFTGIDPSKLVGNREGAVAPLNQRYGAQVLQCALDGGVKEFSAFLIHPDGNTTPLGTSYEMVERFNPAQVLQTALRIDSNATVNSLLNR